MNATGLPLPAVATATTQPTAEPIATPMQEGERTSTDFVLALAQMLGAAVPANTATHGVAADAESDSKDAQAAALALLPLPIGAAQGQPALGQAGTEASDPLEMLGLTGQSERTAARDAALLQALTERLTQSDAKSQQVELPGGAMASLDPVQQRPTMSEAPHSRPLQQPVGTQAWADELGARLTMMTEKGQHTASLRLSPEHLGPLEIRIAMRDDQASVWFGAAHADTRAAIEHALPRLRELFAEQGMSLADAGVFREPPKQSLQQWPVAEQRGGDAPAPVEELVQPARVQLGLLDAYA